MKEERLDSGSDGEDKASPARPSRWPLAGAWGLVLVALLIRSYGLSHDFDLGKVYHPDTPKQIRAAQRFSHGEFYSEMGHDYDGYPLFSSLMAAGLCHVVEFVADTGRAHLGLHADPESVADVVVLEWIMRIMNVVLSSLSVWVLFLLARRMSRPGPALVAAALFCISPLDVAACHYASGDSAVGFFALVSILFSVRILQRGGTLDYVLAAAACMCSFSAKYHGAMAAVSLITAHILRARSARELFGIASIRRAVLVLVTAGIVFFLTNPATLVRTGKGIEQILDFLFSASQFGQTHAMRAMNPLSRWFYSVKLNVPVFAECLSPILLVFALAGVGLALFTDKARRVVAALPILYILVGLSRKTAGNAVYNTVVTPALFLLGALVLFDLMRLRVLRPLPWLSAWLLLLASGLMLANGTYREMFFFARSDTRVLAENWVRENVPSSFQVRGERYSFLSGDDLLERKEPFAGTAVVRISDSSLAAPRDAVVRTFWLEENSLSLFRNFPMEICVQSPLIRKDWELPVYQKIPSRFAPDVILADGGDFFSSPKVFGVRNGTPVEKTILSRRGLEDLVLRVQCGPLPARLEVTVGGQTRHWRLEPEAQQWALVKDLRPRWPRLKDLKAYRIQATAEGGPVQVALAFGQEEKGMMLFNAGAYPEASAYLRDALDKGGNPTAVAMAQVGLALGASVRQAAPRDKPALVAQWTDGGVGKADISRLYRVESLFLDGLPYLAWGGEKLEYKGFAPVRPDGRSWIELQTVETTNLLRTVRSPWVTLDRGCYSARLLYRLGSAPEAGVTVTVKFIDASGCEIAPAQVLPLEADASGTFRNLDLSFAKPSQPASVRLVLDMPATADVHVRGMEIRPDVMAGVDGLAHLLEAVVYGGDPHAASSPANFDLLLAMGRKLAREGAPARGADFLLAAAESCPARLAPAETLAELLPAMGQGSVPPAMAAAVSRYRDTLDERRVQPAEALFSKGIRLSGFILKGQKVRAGEPVFVKLLWNVSGMEPDYESFAVWIHCTDGQGHTVFQGDFGLVESLIHGSIPRTFGMDGFLRVLVPTGTAPGEYRVCVGLWQPGLRKRLRAKSTGLPVRQRGVEIATVTVE